MARPTLKIAVAGTKSKASDYNENFETLMDYFETTIDDAIGTYIQVNTLASSGTVSLNDNSINKISVTGAVTFSLPSIGSGDTDFHQILVQMYMPTVVSLNLGTSYFFNGVSPDMSWEGHYNIVFEYDNTDSHWYCAAIHKGYIS